MFLDDNTPKPTRKPNPIYEKIKGILTVLDKQMKTKQYQLKLLISQKEGLEQGVEGLLPIAGTLGGMFINLPKTAEDEKGKAVESNWLRFGAIALGLGGGFLAKKVAKKNREQSLKDVKTGISKTARMVQNLKDKIALCKVRLSRTDKYIELPAHEFSVNNHEPESSSNPISEIIPPNDLILTDEKIICSNDLMKKDFQKQ